MPGNFVMVVAVLIYVLMYLTPFLVLALLPGIKSMAAAVLLVGAAAVWLQNQVAVHPGYGPGRIVMAGLALGFVAWALRMAIPRRFRRLRGIAVVALAIVPTLLFVVSASMQV